MRRKLLSIILTLAMVLSLIPGFSVSVKAAEITDTLTKDSFDATGTSYVNSTGVEASSDARYAANSATSNDAIQLRSNNSNSGIVSTTSGGIVKSVTVTWNSNTNQARVLAVYGSNTAYSAATDLYDSSKQGTLIGELSYSATANTISFTDDYAYVGIRSKSGAMYLDSVSIVWENGESNVHVHNWSDWTSNNDGTHSRTCSAANCTVEGAKETANCTFGEAVVTTEPDCIHTGLQKSTCTVCGYEQTESIDPTGVHADANNDGICDVCGEEMEPAAYVKTSSISVGDVVVLVAEGAKDSPVEFSGLSSTTTQYGVGTAYTSVPEGVSELTVVEGSAAGTFAFDTGAGYLCWNSGNSLQVSESLDANSSWTVSFDENGNAEIKNAADSTRHIRWNYSSPRFACYTTDQTPVQLYKAPAAEGEHEHSYAWNGEVGSNGTHTEVCANTDGKCDELTRTVACSYDAGTVTTEPDCIHAGVKTFACTVCGATKTESVEPTGTHTDENDDGKCDVCGEDMPVVVVYTLNDELHDGDKVVIVYTADKMALTTTADGTKLKGVAVTPENDTLTVSDESIAILTVAFEDATNFTLATEDGKFLTSGATGNSLTFADAATDYSIWNLAIADAASKKVYIHSTNASYNGSSQSLEYYKGFTTYGTKTTAYYQFSLYTVVAEGAHEHTWDNGTVTTPATCTADGVMEYTCTECSETKTEPIPRVAHTDNGSGVCSVCGLPLYSRVTTVASGDEIVIYCEAGLEVLTADAAGAQAFAKDGVIAIADTFEDWFTVEVSADSDSDFYLVTKDGKYLATGETGGDLSLLDEQAALALWHITELENGTVALYNTTAAYNGNANQALELYNGTWKTYGFQNNNAVYALEIFKKAAEAPTLNGFNLTLGNTIDPDGDGDLQVNFYVAGITQDQMSNYYMSFKDGDGNVLAERTALNYAENKGVRASLPICMKDYDTAIVATLYAADGTELDSATLEKGAKTYIENAPESVSNIVSALDTLCDLTKELLLDDYTSTKAAPQDHKADLAAYALSASGQGEDASVYGVSLLMKDKIALRVYMRLNGEATATIDSVSAAAEATTDSTIFFYEIKGFTRLTFGTAHTLTVNCGADSFSMSNLSPLSYANIVVNSQSADSILYKVANALYEYHTAVN